MLVAKELREQSVEGLKKLEREIASELFALRNEQATARKTAKPHLVKEKKRDRARVLAVLSEKERSV
jgi:large subunit ribosomal protein L29